MFVAWRLIHLVLVAAWGGGLYATTFQFDGAYYRDIVDHGYRLVDPTYHQFQNTGFFPGLPMVTAPLAALLGSARAGFLVANLTALGAFVAVWAASRRWYGSQVGRHAVVTLALWPTSMFFWAFYTEAIFVVVTAGAMLADRSRRHVLAGVLVVAAGLTRSVGLLFGPVLVAARWWRLRRFDRVCVGYTVAWLATVLGLVGSMQRFVGDGLALSRSQAAWGRVPGAPWTPIWQGIGHVIDELPGLAQETLLNLVAGVLFLVLGVWGTVAALRGRAAVAADASRGPASEAGAVVEEEPGATDARELGPGLWTLAAAGFPHLSTLLSSTVRYVSSAWTGFALLAVYLVDRPRLRWAVWVVMAGLSLVLLRRFAHGEFVA